MPARNPSRKAAMATNAIVSGGTAPRLSRIGSRILARHRARERGAPGPVDRGALGHRERAPAEGWNACTAEARGDARPRGGALEWRPGNRRGLRRAVGREDDDDASGPAEVTLLARLRTGRDRRKARLRLAHVERSVARGG